MTFARWVGLVASYRSGVRTRRGGGAGKWQAISIALLLTAAPRARALDKQGSAHGGNVGGASEGFGVGGSVMLGSSIYNPSYAARPDNSGLALFRYAAHADFDLIGSRLSIPVDVNMFTDAEQQGLAIFKPSEFDIIAGVTSTWPVGPGAIEFGSRVEHDRPVDQGTYTQTYVDFRTRYLYSLARSWTDLGSRGMDIKGWGTLGAFVINPTYAARPDNTGLALFRYALHGEFSILNDLFSFGLDATMFTDKQADNIFRPSELDFTPEIVFHPLDPLEFHVAYETDVPLDRDGRTQTYVYALAVWSFDFQKDPAKDEPPGSIPCP
jgi:hypothetical protein